MGVRPPFSILAAVRAIAPVAGRPPNRPEATLATPVATSSMLERCRLPIMPSATTAESRLSIPAKNAIVNAAGSSLRTTSRLISPGMWGITSVPSTWPKVEVMVATFRPPNLTSSVVMISAASEPGNTRHFLGQKMIIASVNKPTVSVIQLVWPKLCK